MTTNATIIVTAGLQGPPASPYSLIVDTAAELRAQDVTANKRNYFEIE